MRLCRAGKDFLKFFYFVSTAVEKARQQWEADKESKDCISLWSERREGILNFPFPISLLGIPANSVRYLYTTWIRNASASLNELLFVPSKWSLIMATMTWFKSSSNSVQRDISYWPCYLRQDFSWIQFRYPLLYQEEITQFTQTDVLLAGLGKQFWHVSYSCYLKNL